MVEQTPEERRVVSSILTRGTICLKLNICYNFFTRGYGSMVELLLAMERIGVRFPLAAPKKKAPL